MTDFTELQLDRLLRAIKQGKTDNALMAEFHLNYASLKEALEALRQTGLRARIRVALRNKDGVPFRQWFVYHIDRIIRSPLQVQLMVLVTFAMILSFTGAVVLSFLTTSWENFPKNLWWAFLHVSDPGYLGDNQGFVRQAVAVVITLGGWMLFGLFLSILGMAFQRRWRHLESGKSRVLARDHTVILGWDPVMFKIIDKLLSDPSNRRERIVILSDTPAPEMMEMVSRWCLSPRKSSVLCRTGNPDRVSDLLNINLPFCREIISLPSGRSNEETLEDSYSVTTLFGCIKAFEEMSSDRWRKSKYTPRKTNIALTTRDRRVARALRHLEKENQYLEIHVAEPYDFYSRLLAVSAMMPGIQHVFEELISSEGNAVYIKPLSTFCGDNHLTFGELTAKWDNILPIGYVRYDDPRRSPIINPADDSVVLGPEDELAFFAAHSSPTPVKCTEKPQVKFHAVPGEPAFSPRNILVPSQNSKAKHVVRYLSRWLPSGSRLIVSCPVSEQPFPVTFDSQVSDGTLAERVEMIKRCFREGEHDFDAVVLVSGFDDIERNDAQILLETVAIRQMEEERDSADPKPENAGRRTSIVAELFSGQHAQLSAIAGLDVAIVTTDLICDYLFRAVEDPRSVRVLRDLLRTRGSEPVLIRAKELISFEGAELPRFITVMKLARNNMIRDAPVMAIGYMRKGEVFINPPRETRIFSTDQIICLAEAFSPHAWS